MKSNKAEIAVFVSGGGTNLQALIDAQKSGIIEHGEIKLVISSNPGAYALERAEKAGINGVTVSKKELGSQLAVEEKITEILEENNIDLIILAGYMSILSADFTHKYERRIINVHPSLIPSFCGEGCEIIMQKAVRVRDGDTPETLQKRVMRLAEWKILPAAAEKISDEIVRKKAEEK